MIRDLSRRRVASNPRKRSRYFTFFISNIFIRRRISLQNGRLILITNLIGIVTTITRITPVIRMGRVNTVRQHNRNRRFQTKTVSTVKIGTTTVTRHQTNPRHILAIKHSSIRIRFNFQVIPARRRTGPHQNTRVINFMRLGTFRQFTFNTTRFSTIKANTRHVQPNGATNIINMRVRKVTISHRNIQPTLNTSNLRLTFSRHTITLRTTVSQQHQMNRPQIFATVRRTIRAPTTRQLQRLNHQLNPDHTNPSHSRRR